MSRPCLGQISSLGVVGDSARFSQGLQIPTEHEGNRCEPQNHRHKTRPTEPGGPAASFGFVVDPPRSNRHVVRHLTIRIPGWRCDRGPRGRTKIAMLTPIAAPRRCTHSKPDVTLLAK